MRSLPFRRAMVALAFVLPLLAQGVEPPPALAAPQFEAPGKFPAARHLPADELSGPEWKVAPEATSDGMFNLYTVESRFGSLAARGRSQVGIRAKEVEAMSELERVSKSDVFKDAVIASAVAPVKVVASFATKPTETVQGISEGVQRFWSKTKFQAKEVSHDAKETAGEVKQDAGDGEKGETTAKAKDAASSYAKKYLGLSGAERRWYAELGVDPYTDNEALRAGIQEISRVEAAAKFGMRFAGLPGIPGARELGKVMDLVWSTDPWELRQRNRKLLLAAGLTEDRARAFEDNVAMSPTFQTAMIESLTALEGVEGRAHLIDRATEVEDGNSARLLVTSTALLVRYHRQVGPLTEILPGAMLPVARAKSGRLVAVLLADVLFWTEEVAGGARGFAERYAEQKASGRELRVVGEASARFQKEVGTLGWEVVDGWQVAAPEDRAAASRAAGGN